ncbi:MAG: hypothetical protein EA405_13080 [Rhodospirillales bacterium]|nr:MAG: hypothetical protein EA405_13080 [Rhodospirillales bacterium]
MRITNNDEYRQALDRADELRNAEETAESSDELARLQAAIEAYEALPDKPDVAKGRPTPKPYDH